MKKINSYDDELYDEAVVNNTKLRKEIRKNKKLMIKKKRELKYSKYAY